MASVDVQVVAVNGAKAVKKALDKAVRDALTGCTEVPKTEIKRRLRGGYTSGDYVTGRVLNSVRTERAQKDAQGVYTTRVGTNVPYALYWELGHNNVFIGRNVRAEVWKPAIVATREDTAQAFGRMVRKSLARDLKATSEQIDRMAEGLAIGGGSDIEVSK